MSLADFAVIFATLLGPVLAVQAQKLLERTRDAKRRKEQVFRTLMATRAARISPEHVQALNMIDFEYYGGGRREQEVREAWNEYRDHLNTKYAPEALPVWSASSDDLFFELLHRMAACVDLPFEKAHIKKSAYSPIAHGNLEQDQTTIRAGLVALFSNKFAIPVSMQISDKEAKAQAELRELVFESLSGKRPYRVEVVNPEALSESADSRG